MEDDIKKMENAAMAAYLKDVENNTRDMTADRIIKEKMSRIGTKDTSDFNRSPAVTPETVPRFKVVTQQFAQEIDPCDPTVARNTTTQQAKSQQKGESKSQGKSRMGKGKGKGKKASEEERATKPIGKLWYEAVTPEGYTYYWHIETNESVWYPPEEGYATLKEQEEEAKERAIQEELLEQLEREEAAANADIIEEKRANAEREKLKGLRKISDTQAPRPGNDENAQRKEKTEGEEESRPYRRDYSIPMKSHPYGPWQTVRNIETKPVDLQLPRQRQLQLPVFEKTEPPPAVQRTFKEKIITRIDAGDSEEDRQPTAFKKRKIGNKNVRKRLTDD